MYITHNLSGNGLTLPLFQPLISLLGVFSFFLCSFFYFLFLLDGNLQHDYLFKKLVIIVALVGVEQKTEPTIITDTVQKD